jgi:phospholipid/cholesterol/gamma-HCH transport system substrate-binding protein
MKIKNEVAVGVLFTIAMLILGYFTIMVRHEVFESEEFYTISVRFTNVEGLEVKDNVNVNGVRAGVVSDIELEQEYVVVYLKVFKRFPMYENYRIKIASESALGGRLISIYPGERLKNGKTYREIEERTNLKGISGDDPFAAIASLVEENRENVRNTINNIQQITAKINSGQGTLGKLLNESKVHDNANDLVGDLREAVEDTREQAPITSFIRAALTAF